MPTKREQADLFAAVFSAHGDTVRPVLAPISVADIFGVTVEAFNIAEQYQTPVIVLSDQEIAQRKEIVRSDRHLRASSWSSASGRPRRSWSNIPGSGSPSPASVPSATPA